MSVWIGTSGCQYRHWRGRFHPAGLPQQAWLQYYAERFATVEVNASFYRLPSPAAVEDWRRMPTRPGDGPGSAGQRDWWHLRKG